MYAALGPRLIEVSKPALQRMIASRAEQSLLMRVDPYFYDIRIRGNHWEESEIDCWKQKYRFLPDSYLNFLECYDSPSIAFVRFFGSENSELFSISEQVEEYENRINTHYFSIGYDADESVFLVDKQSRICMWDKYDYDFEKIPKLVANTFEEFICLEKEHMNS